MRGLAFYVNDTPVAFHNAVRDRKAESRAFADLFGSEEGLKDFALNVFVHSHTSVNDINARIALRRRLIIYY
jgi:hypothetical protein